MIFWSCFSSKRTGQLIAIRGIMKSEDDIKIPGENLQLSMQNLDLGLRVLNSKKWVEIFNIHGCYLHFSDYCPHLYRHVYPISAAVHSGLLQVVGMSNLTLYFAYRGRVF